MRIGIDMMGGDYSPGSTIRGSILAKETLPDNVEVILIGDQEFASRYAEENNLDIAGLTIIHTPDSVGMEDHPLKVFKEKPMKENILIGINVLVLAFLFLVMAGM